jgi:hypothetical protein
MSETAGTASSLQKTQTLTGEATRSFQEFVHGFAKRGNAGQKEQLLYRIANLKRECGNEWLKLDHH